jgi:hypothetical protein
MTIIAEQGGLFRFRLTRQFIDFMAEHRITTTYQEGPSRWKEGSHLLSGRFTRLNPHTAMLNGDALIQLGCFSYCHSALQALQPQTKIGRYCSIAWNVRVMGPPHPLSYVSTSPLLFSTKAPFGAAMSDFGSTLSDLPYDWKGGGPVEIGNDVWIGQDVLLARKARLGHGCVVAAGAVVTGVVPPYAVVAGVPAKVIRYRFDPDVIAGLLETQWWDYALPEMGHLPMDDPEAFVDGFRRDRDAGRLKPYSPNLGLAYDVVKAIG